MVNIIIKPSSERSGNRWIPAGIVRFYEGVSFTERVEWYYDLKFDTEKEANQYFILACKKKYKTI